MKSFNVYILGFILIVACLIAAGCGPINSVPIDKDRYMLKAERAAEEAVVGDKALKVRDFTVSHSFASEKLIYRTSQTKYELDYYKCLFGPTGSVLSCVTKNWLADSGLFKSVLSQSSSVNTELILEGHVSEIYGDFRDKKSPSAIVAIQFVLLENAPRGYEIFFEKEYKAAVALEESSPEGLMKGYGSAMSQILQSLEVDLKARLIQ